MITQFVFTDGRKLCAICQRLKPLGAFDVSKNSPSGQTSDCLLCLSNRDESDIDAKDDPLVDNAPLRAAVLALTSSGEITFAAIARDIGYVHGPRSTPDVTAVKRRLGIKKSIARSNGRTYRRFQTLINPDLAARIARACGLDPVDVGL